MLLNSRSIADRRALVFFALFVGCIVPFGPMTGPRADSRTLGKLMGIVQRACVKLVCGCIENVVDGDNIPDTTAITFR